MRAIFLGLSMLAMATPAIANHVNETASFELVTVTDLGAGNYSFLQTGFDEGAFVSGSFTGFDLDNDLYLDSFLGEISNFTFSFSGNSLVAAWNSNDGDLVYDLLDPGFIGDEDEEGIAVNFFAPVTEPLYLAGPGPLLPCGLGDPCGVVVAGETGAVPEPASWAMLIAGFGLTGAMLRRRRAATQTA